VAVIDIRTARALRRPLPPASGPVASDREATLDRLDELARETMTPAELLARVADLEADAERAQQRLARARVALVGGVCAPGASGPDGAA
jgi:hypothetical protein